MILVLERARLALVGVADEVLGHLGVHGGKAPLDLPWESRRPRPRPRSPDRFTLSITSTGRMPKEIPRGPYAPPPWAMAMSISRPPGTLILFRSSSSIFPYPICIPRRKKLPCLFQLPSPERADVHQSPHQKTVCNGCRAGCLTLFPCPKDSVVHAYFLRIPSIFSRRQVAVIIVIHEHRRSAVAPADALDPSW